MTRDEFKVHAMAAERIYATSCGLLEDAEPFWSPEVRDGWQASHFLECLLIDNMTTPTFWVWCKENLTKCPMCFMMDTTNDKSWWGFNTEQDSLLFALRWA